MTDDRLDKIKAAIEAADHIPDKHKAELLGHLSKIKPVLGQVAQTHQDDARTVAKLVESSTEIATGKEKKPEVLTGTLHRLKQSVERFEASHPQLAAAVNEYSTMLSALGF